MFDYDVMNDTLDIDLDEDNANIIQLSEEDYESILIRQTVIVVLMIPILLLT
jgi:hypothetical protein